MESLGNDPAKSRIIHEKNAWFHCSEHFKEDWKSEKFLTLSLLGYLKTRICWGGVNLTPSPSKSHVWFPNMTNDTSFKSSCALLLESAKKNANLQKLNFFCKIQLYSKNVCKKNCPKTKIIHFWKALDHAISNMQKVLQNFKKPDVY